jgi:hypothetical protein
MRLFLAGLGLMAAYSSYAQMTPSETPSSSGAMDTPNVQEVFIGVGQQSNPRMGISPRLLQRGDTAQQDTASPPNITPSGTPSHFQSYVLHLTREQFVFLDAPKTQDNNTKTFFYHIVKGDNPTVMQMLHTTANCSAKQLKIDSNTLVSLDPPKVLNYEVVKKGWINLDTGELDQAIFKYVCFNEVTTGYTLDQPTGRAVVMYYNYLQQPKK